MIKPIILFLIFWSALIQAIEADSDGITVDLRSPSYSEGKLSSEEGGVITAPGIRIQARRMQYTRQIVEHIPVVTVEAEEELMLEFGPYILTGEKLTYDFQKKEGVIVNGKCAVEPWFFGGERLELRPDGSILIYNGYITTSEKQDPDWNIHAASVEISKEQNLRAHDVSFRFFKTSVFWIPSLKANLDFIFDSPIRYRFRWGGSQGPRFGFTYELFSLAGWKTFARFDYRLTRGPGGGFEIRYASPDKKTYFESINYVAKDASLLSPHEKACYRFEGVFKKEFNEKVNLLLSYDKISDPNMPSNYEDRNFDIDTSKRTQFLLRRQEAEWIAQFYVRTRINSFQTVKQELPSLSLSFKPYLIRDTGAIFVNQASVSYLNYQYSKHVPHVQSYDSTKFAYFPTLYRPIQMGPATLTPELGLVSIFYGNKPHGGSTWLGLIKTGCAIQSRLYRFYQGLKHLFIPYTSLFYTSHPTSSPDQHYIFSIEDGWASITQWKVGTRHAFYSKKPNNVFHKFLEADIWANAFFDPKVGRYIVPKVHASFNFEAASNLRYLVDTAWDLEHREVGHLNFRTEWTLNSDCALAFEYRHRNGYTWRKADRDNFYLEAFHSEKRLHHSLLSDRRDTLLVHLFYRFHPDWACEAISRQGWNRAWEPKYLEYELNLLTTIQRAWHLRLSFQRQEHETRLALYLNVGLKKPKPQEFVKA